MRFTAEQYNEAIDNLMRGRQQLEPDGNCCSICGDSGHMAFECGHNPLLAMALCRRVAEDSDGLHETLHFLAGFDQRFGVQAGPAKIILPERTKPTEEPCKARQSASTAGR
jgi:hypothetical protein